MLDFLYLFQFYLKKGSKLYTLFYWLGSIITNLFLYSFYRIFYRFIEKPGIVKEQRDPEIIVSLTSFPARINEVCICIETIMKQTFKPNRIILWLASSQFENNSSLPKHLLYLQKRGLEIKFCEDLRSHKKYFFTMRDNPDSIVITLDDDVYYPSYTLKQLIDSYEKNRNCISCNNAKYINRKENKIQPYSTWISEDSISSKKSIDLVPIGVSGVLYPPESLSKELWDLESIKKLCFHTDDLWLKAMSLLQHTEVVYSGQFPTLFCIGSSQKQSLGQFNCLANRNDIELNNIKSKFPHVF